MTNAKERREGHRGRRETVRERKKEKKFNTISFINTDEKNIK